MTDRSRLEIRIAGFGGQGVVTAGRILGTAFSVFAGRNSVNTQSYGPESRGGACRSEVVVADGEINYPYVRRADVLVALSQVALSTYIKDLKEGGILVIDAEAVKVGPEADRFRLYPVPFVALAHQAGDLKGQNMVALGALWVLLGGLIAEEPLLRAIREGLPAAAVDFSLAAFEKGKNYIQARLAGE